jgi:hypothetical protein
MEATLEQTKQNASPTLTCIITGTTRPSNEKYLHIKAEKKGVSVAEFSRYYACKAAVKRLRTGMSVADIRTELAVDISTPVSEEDIKTILQLNGKSKS